MKIADLFVSLGVKGGEKTTGQVKNVKKEMKGLKEVSIEAKAAILATFYGIHRLTSGSMNAGTELNKFANLTGLSTKKLQQWQYANKQAGGTAEEVTSMITGMQQALASMEMGEGPAKYLGLFATSLDDFDQAKMKDIFYTLEKAREFANRKGPKDIGQDNAALASLGLTDSVIAGLRSGAFDDKMLNRATVYSDGQIKELARIKAMWSDLGDTIEKEVGKINTKVGGQLVKDIAAGAKQIAELVTQLIVLSQKVGIFESISKAMENTANALSIINGHLNGSMDPQEQAMANQTAALAKAGLVKDTHAEMDAAPLGGTLIGKFFKMLIPQYRGVNDDNELIKNSIVPNSGRTPQSVGGSTLVVEQTINLTGTTQQANDVRSAAKQGVQSAYSQLQAQGL